MVRFTIPRISHCNEGHAKGPGQDRKLSSIIAFHMVRWKDAGYVFINIDVTGWKN